MDFLLRCILALFLASLIGLERAGKDQLVGFKTYLLLCLCSTISTYLALHLFVKELNSFFIVSQSLLVVGLFGLGLIIKSHLSKDSLFSACLLFLVAGIGILIGSHYINLAIMLTALLLILALIFRFFEMFTSHYTKHYFVLNVEIKKLKSLDEIDYLIKKFNFSLIKKALVKSDMIHLELEYYAYPVANKIFLKKIYQLSGIGEVIRITL